MSDWKLFYTSQARRDAKKLNASGLRPRAERVLAILRRDSFEPPFEKLVGDLAGAYSRRINIQHRLVYQVYVEQQRAVKVIRLWTHYE